MILADTRRLADCFASVDYFERHSTPFVVAVNRFNDAPHHPTRTMSGSRSTSTRARPRRLTRATGNRSRTRADPHLVRRMLTQTSPAAEYQSAPLPARSTPAAG